MMDMGTERPQYANELCKNNKTSVHRDTIEEIMKIA